MRICGSGDAADQGLRPRFGLRALLVFVALAAFALVGGRQWMLLRNARSEFERTRALWMGSVVVDGDVELAANEPFEREAATVWIGRSAAKRRQAERLRQFADTLEAMSRVTLHSSGDFVERDQKRAEELRRKAVELR
jgi:hypothetical protein